MRSRIATPDLKSRIDNEEIRRRLLFLSTQGLMDEAVLQQRRPYADHRATSRLLRAEESRRVGFAMSKQSDDKRKGV